MSEISKGDKVKIEYTATVREVDDRNGIKYARLVRDGDGAFLSCKTDFATVIEPEYEEGMMYVDADGDFFAYWPDVDAERPWWAPGSGSGNRDDYPTRPLRKLVPEA